MKRLYLKIWLAVFASGVVGIVAGLISARFLLDPGVEVQNRLANMIVAQLDSAQANVPATLRTWSASLGAPLRVTYPNGDVAAAGVFPPGSAAISLELRDSAVLEVGRIPFPQPPVVIFAGTLSLIALFVALATYPIVRRITRRLEDLRASVLSLGDGDLTARVPGSGSDEVGELAQSFNRAAGRIEALIKANQSLLANASHELRSPLARIRMATELLADGHGINPDTGSMREIRSSIGELDELIDEILTASTLQARGPQNPAEPLDLAPIAKEEAQRVQADCALVPMPLLGHPVLLRRAIRNLLENAGKYGAGRPIALTLERRGDSAVLTVADQGIGVPEEERERIFDAFYRRRGGSESQGGVGLGLALVRQIVQLHQGTVLCEANAPRGSRFVLRLPIASV